jgi:diguanylate cyclase (GGDEF)-like protein
MQRLRDYLYRLSTPGELPSTRVLVAATAVMLAIFAVDITAPGDMRLHVLYLFPLTAIGLHCDKGWASIWGIALATAFQLADHFYHGLSDAAAITDAILAFSTVLLTVSVSRSLRDTYLATRALAMQDTLTGLNNRHKFEFAVEAEILRQKRYGGVFSLAVIDLDRFKALNDSRGHQFGDIALKLTGEVLRQATRQSDSTARLGGDEFAVLMPNTGAAEGKAACSQLAGKIAARMREAGFSVTASIGCATFEQAPESSSVALHSADKAMYGAKLRSR